MVIGHRRLDQQSTEETRSVISDGNQNQSGSRQCLAFALVVLEKMTQEPWYRLPSVGRTTKFILKEQLPVIQRTQAPFIIPNTNSIWVGGLTEDLSVSLDGNTPGPKRRVRLKTLHTAE
ncbi:hypothetical protein CBL_02724 [Carabus blaptoides fortunei]